MGLYFILVFIYFFMRFVYDVIDCVAGISVHYLSISSSNEMKVFKRSFCKHAESLVYTGVGATRICIGLRLNISPLKYYGFILYRITILY